MDVTDALAAKDALVAATTAASTEVANNETQIEALQNSLMAADDAIMALEPIADVFITNPALISWSTTGINEVAESIQCVQPGETVQFYLSMTATFVDEGEIIDVQLVKNVGESDEEVVAKNTVAAGLADRQDGRNFALYYEEQIASAENGGSEVSYSVRVLKEGAGTPTTP